MKGRREISFQVRQAGPPPFLSESDESRLTFESSDACPGHAEKEDRGRRLMRADCGGEWRLRNSCEGGWWRQEDGGGNGGPGGARQAFAVPARAEP